MTSSIKPKSLASSADLNESLSRVSPAILSAMKTRSRSNAQQCSSSQLTYSLHGLLGVLHIQLIYPSSQRQYLVGLYCNVTSWTLCSHKAPYGDSISSCACTMRSTSAVSIISNP